VLSPSNQIEKRSRNLRVRQPEPNQKDKLVHDIYGVVGPLGLAGGTEVNLSKGSGNDLLADSQLKSYGSSGLKRSSSSGMVQQSSQSQIIKTHISSSDSSSEESKSSKRQNFGDVDLSHENMGIANKPGEDCDWTMDLPQLNFRPSVVDNTDISGIVLTKNANDVSEIDGAAIFKFNIDEV
jgi:hypothetical protein